MKGEETLIMCKVATMPVLLRHGKGGALPARRLPAAVAVWLQRMATVRCAWWARPLLLNVSC